MKLRLPKLIAVAAEKFHSTRLRQVGLVNSLTMLPALQLTLVPVTLMRMVVALPGASSICCTSELEKRELAAIVKTAMPQSSTWPTVKRAGPGWPLGSETELLGATAARSAEAPCRVAVSGPLLSDGSDTVDPPPLKLMMRPLVEPLMRRLPAWMLIGLPATRLPTTSTVASEAGAPPRWAASVEELGLVKLPPTKVRPSTSELVDRSPSVIRL